MWKLEKYINSFESLKTLKYIILIDTKVIINVLII